MTSVVLILHLVVAVALICLVLMQRSEGGALGMGGGSSSLISGRGAADVLARGTAVLAAIFLITSIALTVMAGGAHKSVSVIDDNARPGLFGALFQKHAPAPAKPAPAARTQPPPAPPAPAAPGDIVPPPAESMQRAGPLEGPTVAPLPPVSAVPAAPKAAAEAPPVSAAKPAESRPKPAIGAAAKPPVSAAAAAPAKPTPAAASAARPKPIAHSGAPAPASGAESGQPAPPPSRAGPDE